MTVNKFHPYVLVLPEDDANRQLAIGFLLDLLTIRQVQVLRPARGWTRVRDGFAEDHVDGMRLYGERYVVLLIDFDGNINRLHDVKTTIPPDLIDRVFVLGAWSEPEALRQDGLGSFETIGMNMARDCRNGTQVTWGHALLRHNEDELIRLRHAVCGLLFPAVVQAATNAGVIDSA